MDDLKRVTISLPRRDLREIDRAAHLLRQTRSEYLRRAGTAAALGAPIAAEQLHDALLATFASEGDGVTPRRRRVR
jgi:hypothetical protein